jgi:hypothetical protein
MSHIDPELNRLYHRQYYRRNAKRLRVYHRHRQQIGYWALWLLANLEWPEEPTPIYPKSYPIRRPTLHLPKRSS